MTRAIKKLVLALRFALIAAIFAVAINAGVSKVGASTPGQVGSAPRCTVDGIGARGSAFHPSGSKTTVKFKVSGGSNCKVRLSANSFYAPSMNGRPYSKQILYQRVTKTFSRGTYSMTVGIPTKSTPAKGCFYQVDLTYGIHNITPVLAYGHGKIAQCGVPKLTCQGLTASLVPNVDRTYRFTATAAASNTTVTKYVFNFGDGKTQTVNTSARTAQVTHQYSQIGSTLTASVAVSSRERANVTSANCRVTVTVPTPNTPALICDNLTFTPIANKINTYKFVARASASNTTIVNYVFTLDGSDATTVTTSSTSATTTHAFDRDGKQHTATVMVTSTDLRNVTSAKCAVSLNSPTTPPKNLPNTGAGDMVGFFAATTAAGAFLHRFLLRRKAA